MNRAPDQGLAAAALAAQTRQRLESIRDAQQAIADAQRQIAAAEQNGGK